MASNNAQVPLKISVGFNELLEILRHAYCMVSFENDVLGLAYVLSWTSELKLVVSACARELLRERIEPEVHGADCKLVAMRHAWLNK